MRRSSRGWRKSPAHEPGVGAGSRQYFAEDEGVGVRVVEHLQENHIFPDEVQVLDGGTTGLDLLLYLEGVEHLLVVDAVDARRPPGSIIRLTDDEIQLLLGRKLSPHQIGLADLLSVARLRDLMPPQVVLIGVQQDPSPLNHRHHNLRD